MPGTISESHQQSCAIEWQQRFFRCSNCDHIFVSETHSKRLQNYSVSESEGAPLPCAIMKAESKEQQEFLTKYPKLSVSNVVNSLILSSHLQDQI